MLYHGISIGRFYTVVTPNRNFFLLISLVRADCGPVGTSIKQKMKLIYIYLYSL